MATPNHTTARVLQSLIGDIKSIRLYSQIYLIYRRLQKEFRAKTVVGSGKLERLNVGVSVVNFRVGGISSKQVQQLKALEYLM